MRQQVSKTHQSTGILCGMGEFVRQRGYSDRKVGYYRWSDDAVMPIPRPFDSLVWLLTGSAVTRVSLLIQRLSQVPAS